MATFGGTTGNKRQRELSDKKYVMPKQLPKHVAVVGSRTFPKLEKVMSFVDHLSPDTILISGGAKGVDYTAEVQGRNTHGWDVYKAYPENDPYDDYADQHIIVFPVRPADWDYFGKAAGPLRNKRLVRFVKDFDGAVVVFLHIKNKKPTPGSDNVTELCQEYHVPYYVFSEET